MSRSRRLRLRLAMLAVLGLLFAQWSVAAYACTIGVLAQGAVTHADCDDAGPASTGALCHKHCIGDEGGSRADPDTLPASAPCPLAAHPGSLTVAAQIAFAPAPATGRAPPPLTILLHRFLT